MKEQGPHPQQAWAYLDSLKLRILIFELSREHERLHLPLVNVAACGSAVAANPVNPEFRREAREAWNQMMAVVERHLQQKNDLALASSAEKLNLISSSLREAVAQACDWLSHLAHQISGVDFERASAESVAQAGDSMRKFAVALDDLAVREEHELLPKLHRMLFEHTSPARHK